MLAENDDRQDKGVFIRTGLDLSLQVMWLNKQGGTATANSGTGAPRPVIGDQSLRGEGRVRGLGFRYPAVNGWAIDCRR